MCRPASVGCPRSCCTSGMALPIMHLIARGTQRLSEGGAGVQGGRGHRTHRVGIAGQAQPEAAFQVPPNVYGRLSRPPDSRA
jgi:hypothetical protein